MLPGHEKGEWPSPPIPVQEAQRTCVCPPRMQGSLSETSAFDYVCRSEFRVWHDKDDVYYIMFEKVGRRQPCSNRGEAQSRGLVWGRFQLVPLLAAKAAGAGWPRDALVSSHLT